MTTLKWQGRMFSSSLKVEFTSQNGLLSLHSLVAPRKMSRKQVKALVLTFDKNRSLTDHMIRCYEKQWPTHPFVFHIPHQSIGPTIDSERVRYFPSGAAIQETVSTLLHGLDDEEMIYWCIDDKYPIRLDIKHISAVNEFLLSNQSTGIDGLLSCRCRGMLQNRNLTGNYLRSLDGERWLERLNYSQIWIHQYLRVKVLRHLFASFPVEVKSAKSMDKLKKIVNKPKEHHIYVTRRNHCAFGESTSRGILTKNCLNSMRRSNVALPAWAAGTPPQRSIFMGRRLPGFAYRLFGQ